VEVDGGEVSLANYGRTRDSRFRLIFNGSDLVNRQDRPRGDLGPCQSKAGRGSPPIFLEETKNRGLSEIRRAGYITADSRR
jgi:hypothetical protein